MEPNMPTFQTQYQQQTRRNTVIILVLIVLVLLFAGVTFFMRDTGFRVVSTDPKLSAMPNIAPYMNVVFSEQLSDDDIQVSSSPSITESHTVKDKTLKIRFKADKMTVDTDYTITIKSIKSASGETLTNKELTFTAKDVDFDSLSKEMQTAIIGAQDQFPYTPNSYQFTGIETLDDYGLTQDATAGLRQAVFNYGKSIKQEVKSATLYSSSVTTTIADPEKKIPAINFTLDINDQTFSAQLNHWNLSKVQLYLRDTKTNALVYDSGVIDTYEDSQDQ